MRYLQPNSRSGTGTGEGTRRAATARAARQTLVERVGRKVLGLAAVIAAAALLASAGSVLAVVLEVLLAAHA